MTDHYGIVNHPENPDLAVLTYDGEPIGTIERRYDAGAGLRFRTAGLSVRGADILDGEEHGASIGGTSEDRFTPAEYAAWKASIGLHS